MNEVSGIIKICITSGCMDSMKNEGTLSHNQPVVAKTIQFYKVKSFDVDAAPFSRIPKNNLNVVLTLF